MIERRGLIVGSFDTAAHGFTMSKLHLQTPQGFEDWVEVDGMSGALDYSEAAVGYVLYQTSPLEAVFELSEGNKAHREKIIAEFIRAVHGRSCRIVHPDHGGKLLKGRVQLSKDYSDLAHAQVTLKAVCMPYFEEPYESYAQIPILDRSHNRIAFGTTSFMEELSSCSGGLTGDTEVVTVTLATTSSDIHTRGVFRVALSANEHYFVSGRLLGNGFWRVSNSTEMPTLFSPVVRTGDDGYLYIFIERLQSYGAVSLQDVVIVPGYEATLLHNGSFPVEASVQKPNGLTPILCVNGTSVRLTSSSKALFLPPEDVPVVAFRQDTTDAEGSVDVRFCRRWLE